MVVLRCPCGHGVGTGVARLALAWALLALPVWPLGAAVSLAGGGIAIGNPSFEQGLDAGGLPLHWQGDAKRLRLVQANVADGSQAVKLAPGGSISQVVPAVEAMDYTLTVQAHTTLFEEAATERYRAEAYLDLTFLPSGKRCRTEMASPFGQSRRMVEHAVGGTAPAGTKRVQVTISTVRSEITVDDVRLAAHRPSSTELRLKPLCIDTAIVQGGKAAAKPAW